MIAVIMVGGFVTRLNPLSINLPKPFGGLLSTKIKTYLAADWALIVPDQYRPFAHKLTDAHHEQKTDALPNEYREKVEQWLQLLQIPT